MADNVLVPGVEYVTYHSPKVIAISPDNGQGITERVSFCTSSYCRRWDGNRPIAPKLTTDDRGFRVCTACGCSYGRDERDEPPSSQVNDPFYMLPGYESN